MQKFNNIANNFTWFYFDEIKDLSKDNLKEIVFKKCNVLLQLDIEGNILKVWQFLNDASRELNIQEGNISQVCAGKRRIAGGFRWAFYNDYIKLEDKSIREMKTTAKAVLKYSLEGKLICSYNSVTEASKNNNIADNRICEVCKKKRNQAGGYIWRYKENPLTESEILNLKNLNFNVCEKESSIPKKIRNIETNEIFDSISEISKKYNCSRKTIKKACLDNTYKCAGYHWEFYKENPTKES